MLSPPRCGDKQLCSPAPFAGATVVVSECVLVGKCISNNAELLQYLTKKICQVDAPVYLQNIGKHFDQSFVKLGNVLTWRAPSRPLRGTTGCFPRPLSYRSRGAATGRRPRLSARTTPQDVVIAQTITVVIDAVINTHVRISLFARL